MSVNCLWGLLRLTTFVLWLCFHRGEGTRAVNLVEVLFICISLCTIWGNAECRSIAAAQAPLQFARNYLSYVIYIRIPLCKGRCTCSLCLSFLLDLFVFCQRCLCVYYRNQPHLGTLVLCGRATDTQNSIRLLLQPEWRLRVWGSWGQTLWGKRGRIRGATVQQGNRFKMAFRSL